MTDEGLAKLCDQDRMLVESVLGENETYIDSLHNDADRTFVAATDLRVVRCAWKYEDGEAKLKSAKSFMYDDIESAYSQLDRDANEFHLIIDPKDGDTLSVIKMPEHFYKEVRGFSAHIMVEIRKRGKTEEKMQTDGSRVGAILANLDELVKLAQLLQMGVISEEDFQEAKSIILERRG